MSSDFRQKSVTGREAAVKVMVEEPASDVSEIILPEELPVSHLYFYWCVGISVLFSLLGTLLLLVVLPALALCISLDSPGPIFYVQERLGYQGKPFKIYKFRSMRKDAEPDGEPIWARSGDERVTRIGQILRKTHLDELPQVLNILQGHMFLIGPRPERAAFAVQLNRLSPDYKYRLLIKPGLTGLAQVKYGYGTRCDELQKLAFDLEYIRHRSIGLDLSILLKTVVEVCTLRGR